MADMARAESLRFDAPVRCLDGACARLQRVVLNPEGGEVSHLIVRIADGRDVVLPMAMVEQIGPEGLALDVASEELKGLPDYVATDFCLPSGETEGCVILSLPDLGVFNPGPLPVEHRQVPPGEVALKPGERVLCSDGVCGRVDQILVDPADDRATGFVVRKGFFFAHDVSIPLSWVRAVDDEGVHLKASRDQLDKLERYWP